MEQQTWRRKSFDFFPILHLSQDISHLYGLIVIHKWCFNCEEALMKGSAEELTRSPPPAADQTVHGAMQLCGRGVRGDVLCQIADLVKLSTSRTPSFLPTKQTRQGTELSKYA